MRHPLLLLCCCLLLSATYAQQSYKSVTFCEATWLVLPKKFQNNFSHAEVELELKSVASLQQIWIGYYSEDTTKIAVVSTIHQRANKKQQRKGIRTSGWLFEFYLNEPSSKKFSCYKQQMKISAYYENGKKRLYSEYYPNGRYRFWGRFDSEEKKDGNWKYYDESGGLTKTVKYKNGVIVD